VIFQEKVESLRLAAPMISSWNQWFGDFG